MNIFLKGIDRLIIGFSFEDKISFQSSIYWIENINEKMVKYGPMSFVLFGSKYDLKEYNIEFFETSIKKNIYINNMLEYLR